MRFRLWVIVITAAASAARADSGDERRTIAAAAPAAGANPVPPLQERKAAPEGDLPPYLEIRGNVVDLETGRTITTYFLQNGDPDPNNPVLTIWGTGESRQFPNFEGSLHHMYIKIGEWSRVIAPGYLPQPLTEKPYDGTPGSIKVIVKLRRGWKVGGRVLDSFKKPVAGASVFLVGGRITGPNITGGTAWIWPETFMRTKDYSVLKTLTDGDGRFLLDGAGGYETAIAISAPALDLWVHKPVPAAGKSCEIILPAPGKLVVRYRIEGGEPEATVSLLLDSENWQDARNERDVKVANGGQVVLDSLTPGTYHVARRKTVRVAGATRSPRLESTTAVVTAGKTSEVALVCESGAAVEGEIIGVDKLKPLGALIYVVKPESRELIGHNDRVDEAVEVLTCDATGRFKTPRLMPGTYTIVAEGYKPASSKPTFGLISGARHPDYRAIGDVTVPKKGPAPRIQIMMRPNRRMPDQPEGAR